MVLSDAEIQFVESTGLFYERLGFPRIGGRMAGLMLLSPEPLPLEEVAAILRVSKASVSTNSRQFIRLGVLEEVSRPGDRRRFLRWHPGTFDGRLAILAAVGESIEHLAASGLAAIRPENDAARARLDYARAFAEFLQAGAGRLQNEWLARRRPNDPN